MSGSKGWDVVVDDVGSLRDAADATMIYDERGRTVWTLFKVCDLEWSVSVNKLAYAATLSELLSISEMFGQGGPQGACRRGFRWQPQHLCLSI